jgi:hypothetical protein
MFSFENIFGGDEEEDIKMKEKVEIEKTEKIVKDFDVFKEKYQEKQQWVKNVTNFSSESNGWFAKVIIIINKKKRT